jgi:hypothetical protein
MLSCMLVVRESATLTGDPEIRGRPISDPAGVLVWSDADERRVLQGPANGINGNTIDLQTADFKLQMTAIDLSFDSSQGNRIFQRSATVNTIAGKAFKANRLSDHAGARSLPVQSFQQSRRTSDWLLQACKGN